MHVHMWQGNTHMYGATKGALWWKKIWDGRNKYFSKLCVLSQNVRVLRNNIFQLELTGSGCPKSQHVFWENAVCKFCKKTRYLGKCI